MQLSRDLAQQIRDKAKAILNREVAVADTSGLILTGPTESGKFAPEALKASQDRRNTTGQMETYQVEWCPFVYEGQVMGVFGIILNDSPVAGEAISLLQGLAEVLVHQYFLIDKVQSTAVVRSNFISELLQAPRIDPEAIYRQADILQLNLRIPQAAILASLDDFEGRLEADTAGLSPEERRLQLIQATEKVIAHVQEGFKNNPDNVVIYLGENIFVILKGIGGSSANTLNTIRFLTEKGGYISELLGKLPRKYTVTVGVGQYYPDLGGLRKSFQDAQLALSVGSKVWGRGKVYHVKEVGMFITLANISQDRKAELAHQILHPLLRDQQLYKTVRLFLANGLNLTEAAKKLHIHRNTLIYRLDKTKKLINLDPRHFDDALQIKLGLMFYQPG